MPSRTHEQCTSKCMTGCRAVRSHHLLVTLQLEQRGGARGENSEAGACGREHEPKLALASSRRHRRRTSAGATVEEERPPPRLLLGVREHLSNDELPAGCRAGRGAIAAALVLSWRLLLLLPHLFCWSFVPFPFPSAGTRRAGGGGAAVLSPQCRPADRR